MEKRIVAVDNLRVLIALFVAIFHVVFFLYLFHAAQLGYIAYTVEQIFFPKMPEGTHSIVFFILTYVPFFMNSFYLMSGFFANGVCRHKGIPYYLKSRLIRIGIPFFAYFFIEAIYYFFTYVLPLMVLKKQALFDILAAQYHQGALTIFFNNTSTYWFLDLLLWYAFAAIVFVLIQQSSWIPKRFFRLCGLGIHKIFLSRWMYITIPLTIVIVLAIGHHWYLVLDDRIIPGWHILCFYGIWFLLGWNIFNDQAILIRIQQHAIPTVLCSIGFYFCHAFLYIHFAHHSNVYVYLLSCTLFALALTLSVFGFMGFFLRYCSLKHPILHYLSDGSYWMYLIQIPIIYIVAAFAVVYIKSFWVQFLVCTGIFAVIYFLSFRYLVQKTRLKKVVA